MAANYVLLEKITLGVATSSITFNSIPQSGYTDLVIKFSGTITVGDVDNVITLNTSTTKTSSIRLYGNGSNKGADGAVGGGLANASSYTANVFGNTEYYFPNYLSSNYKTVSIDAVNENNATQAYTNISVQLFALSSAITSIKIAPNSGSYGAYTTISLYGVAASGIIPAIAPYAAGGDIIQSDGTYWYHAFLSSGTFVPAKNLTSCNYLVVAGGGGAGRGNGTSGGGGAGGLRSTLTATGGGGTIESAISLASGTSYAITIGAGGAGNTATGQTGSNGNDSSIIGGATSITSTGGGAGGGGAPYQNGIAGGSGGGGGEQNGTYGTGGAGTANQGYAGSQGGSSPYRSGGGGGAGAAGSSSTANGGNGVQITAFATPTATGVDSGYYAGGGGGGGTTKGTGGLGGGGTGGQSAVAPIAGTANTGGGGGGAYTNDGKTGGSGIVIIRYAI